MTQQQKQLYFIGAWAVMLVVVLSTFLYQGLAFKQVRGQLAGLKSSQIQQLVVYDRPGPEGKSRVITDQALIAPMLKSLQAGARYWHNHGRNNGFERYVIIQPQQLKLGVYQCEGDPQAMIVSLSGGDIRCPNPAAWKQL